MVRKNIRPVRDGKDSGAGLAEIVYAYANNNPIQLRDPFGYNPASGDNSGGAAPALDPNAPASAADIASVALVATRNLMVAEQIYDKVTMVTVPTTLMTQI
jgi:hypothetical protein